MTARDGESANGCGRFRGYSGNTVVWCRCGSLCPSCAETRNPCQAEILTCTFVSVTCAKAQVSRHDGPKTRKAVL